MSRRIFAVLAAIGLGVSWIALIFHATLHGWVRTPLTDTRSPAAFLAAAEASIPEDFHGNMIALLLQRGHPVGQFAIGPEGAVPDGASVFQIASLSKWVTAAGVLRLVDDVLIALDDPVEDHLTRWRFPDTGFDSRDVTVRRLLSHTAGLIDGLGYNGFADPADVQSLEASLSQADDAMPGATGRVEIGWRPDTRWSYSGGGYRVLQLMVKERTGQNFAGAMADRVFRPLSMENTSFRATDIVDHLVPFFDASGAPAPHFHHTALAAASLYTTADDMAVFLAALSIPASAGGLLSADMLDQMRHPQAHRFRLPIWGLGVTLYALDALGDDRTIIGHDGRNQPAINTTARLHPASGDRIIVLATSSSYPAHLRNRGKVERRTTTLTQGEPMAPLLWTAKSLRNLAAELQALGHSIGHNVVAKLLRQLGYTLQANRKTLEWASHPDRDAQFNYISDHDTASFAVNSIRRWWQAMGRERYPQARRLVITADGGGSNPT